MLRASFRRVAAGTRWRGRHGARVRLVALSALGVPAGRAMGFFLVATLAGGALRAAVWLVTLRALGMAGSHLAQLLGVTAATCDRRGLWLMRQAIVTTTATLVPGAQRHAGYFLRVTVGAEHLSYLLQRESVWSVALGAGETPMKILVRVSRLMTAAALEHRVEQVPRRGVRIMTASARVRSA